MLKASRYIFTNITARDYIAKSGGKDGSITGLFAIPNLRRTSFLNFFWTQHFVARQHVFSNHHVGFITLCVFFWWSGWFHTAPLQRQDKSYMNGAKFRLQSAYANPGSRPAAKICEEQAKIRYYARGDDYPMSLNETKDYLWKVRENLVISKNPGIQYPNVAKQKMPEKTPDVLYAIGTLDHHESGH